MNRCEKHVPEGYDYCTRVAGHEGPCAHPMLPVKVAGQTTEMNYFVVKDDFTELEYGKDPDDGSPIITAVIKTNDGPLTLILAADAVETLDCVIRKFKEQ